MIWTVQNTHQVQAIGEIEHGSDRVIGIVAGAMVEQRLEISLKWRLRPHQYTQKELFKPTGSLGPFKNKIHIGFLLYMYDKPMWLALTGIADIRNKFAHRLEQTFAGGDDEFKAAIGHLTLHEGVKFYPNPFTPSDTQERLKKPKTNKQIFLTNVKLALIALMRDMQAHDPQSNQVSLAAPPSTAQPYKPQGSYLVKGNPRRKGKQPAS
jgi:hypothetical protein